VTNVAEATCQHNWVPLALFLAIVYCTVGVVFQGEFAWRLAAWVICAAAYGVHLAYEHFRWRNSPRSTALHSAVAVALGAFGLAIAATLHRASSAGSGAHLRLYALALVAWPLVTASPAFIVALVVTSVIGWFEKRATSRPRTIQSHHHD
jgi:hypothetical protein